MGSYVQTSLTSGEHVIYEGHLSIWSLFGLILIGVLSLPFFGIGLIFLLVAFIRYKTTELAVTNKRIVAKFGFISRVTIELKLQKTESIQIHQGILGRMLNYGSIIVAGGGMAQAPIPGISNPMQFRQAFLAAQEQAS